MNSLHFVIFFCFYTSFGFSQGFNMKKMAQVIPAPGQEYSAVYGYTDALNNEFAIIGSQTGIHIYDVNNCSVPISVSTHIDGSNTSWREFSSFQNYVYAVCDGSFTSGLKIINMNNYVVTSQTDVFIKAHTIFIEQSQGRMYIMGSRNSANQNRLLIYTLDTEVINGVTYNGTAENPILIRDFPTSYIHDMYVKDNIGYASHIYDYVHRVWDLNNVNNITELHNYFHDQSKYNHSSWLASDGVTFFETIEVPSGEAINIFRKVAGNQALQYIGNLKEPLEFPTSSNNRPHNPHIKDSLMFVSYYEDGVQVFDISNLTSQNTIKRIAYYDTYPQNNGSSYTSGYNGCWGVYPFLPSGCVVASDIDNGLFTLKLDLPVSDGTSPGLVSLADNTDLVFDNSTKGLVLRSEKGYCYRLSVNSAGNLITTRIVCNVNNQTVTQIEKNDLAFNSANRGIILKNDAGICKKLKINSAGQLFMQTSSCTPAVNQVRILSSDLIIETPTKGIILLDEFSNCYRVTVNNLGGLEVLQLTSCP